MGLRAALEERETRQEAPLRIDAGEPDRVYLEDHVLIDNADRYLRHSELGDSYVLVADLWRLDSFVRSRDWGEQKPPWLDSTVSEGAWAYSNKYDLNGVAWMSGSTVVVQTRFTLTLSERLALIAAETVRYSPDMRGWVITNPDLGTDELLTIFSEYDITPSPLLTSHFDGSERWRELLARHVAQAKEDEYEIPSTFITHRKLKPHQEESVLALAELRSGLLADQVGLGKGGSFTGGFLSIIQRWVADGNTDSYGPLVVVVNKSMKDEIAEEILKWKEDAAVVILEGQSSATIDPAAEFVVLNVDLLHHRLGDILEIEPAGLVVDEAHTLKNPGSQRTKAAQSLANWMRANSRDDDGPYIVLASGTPFLNHPAELYSPLCILGVEKLFVNYARKRLQVAKIRIRTKQGPRNVPLRDQQAFEMRWCGAKMNRFNQWELGRATHSAELNRLLLEFVMVRRRKRDIMDPLPPLEENLVLLDLDPIEAMEYDRIETEFLDVVKERAAEDAEEQGITVAEALRIAVQKFHHGEHMMRMTAMRQSVAKGKIAGAKEWIHRFMAGDPEITGGDPTRKKLILFVYHREVQRAIVEDQELKDRYGMVHILTAADMQGASIQENKRKFQEDERCRLIVCYSGAREGHTLTAAKDVALLELPFVPAWIVQMAGRCWARISELFEPHEAYLHYFVSPGTIDSVLLQKNRLKKQFFDQVIDGEGLDEGESGDDLDNVGDIILALSSSHEQRRASLRLAV